MINCWEEISFESLFNVERGKIDKPDCGFRTERYAKGLFSIQEMAGLV